MTGTDALLVADNVRVTFSGITALDDVSLASATARSSA